jgi:hypothetical protein
MLVLTRAIKLAAILLAMLLGVATPSQARTAGVVHLHIVKAGLVIGVGGGNGVLTYRGKRYGLAVNGVGIGSLGIAAVDLVGSVSNLRSPASIAGVYGGGGAGATFVDGSQVTTLQNGNGVVLRLQGRQTGFQLSLGFDGMTISLQ